MKDGEKPIFLSVTDDSINSGVKYIEELFERINPKDKNDFRYRLKSNILPSMSTKECKNLWLWATHSWISSYEKIDSVADGYIYLTANPTIELYQCRLNTDYTTWKVMPRIKVINQYPSKNGIYIDNQGLLYLPKQFDSIFKCDKGSFLSLKESNLKSVEVSGLKFVGGNSPILDINRVLDYAYIHDCEFVCQQDRAIRLDTDNGIVKHNLFKHSMGTVITIPNNGHKNHIISNNIFTNCGQRLLNYGCIKVAGDSILISQNEFHNNLIAAINIGVHYASKALGPLYTIVEDNLIHNDSSILDGYMGNSLLDVSLLYIFTRNDNTIIRRNRFHGFRTVASGNGIFIDDGAFNIKVYDNLITDIEGNLYNINCRKRIVEEAMNCAPDYSTNNFIANNIIDGPIRFEIRDDEESEKYPQSVYGGSIFLKKDNVDFKNKYVNIDTSNDITIPVDNIDLTITVSQDIYDKIIKNDRPIYRDFINKWVKIGEKVDSVY